MTEHKIYKAALIIIGNEILSGRTQDANLSFLAEKLNNQGVRLSEARVILDIERDIVEALNDLRPKYDYVFTTGGIGPTHDDITAASIAKAFGVPLENNTKAVSILTEYYGKNLTDARLKMSEMPIGAEVVCNPVTGAPGFKIENVYVMAGIPKIMKAMVLEILPSLKGGIPVQSISVTLDALESKIADQLRQIQNQYPHIDIGSYPSFQDGHPSVSIVLRGINEKELEKAADQVKHIL